MEGVGTGQRLTVCRQWRVGRAVLLGFRIGDLLCVSVHSNKTTYVAKETCRLLPLVASPPFLPESALLPALSFRLLGTRLHTLLLPTASNH